MLSLTGRTTLVLATVVALAIPALIAWVALRRSRRGRTLTAVVVTLSVLAAQVVAVGAVFLWVNRSYAFYSSWSDLTGHAGSTQDVTVQREAATDGSRTRVLDLRTPSGTETHALAWLPRQYDEASYAHKRFPVVEFLPGQPSTPDAVYRRFDIAAIASRLVDSGKVAPFVMVIPPLMTNPPRDTECTNVPHGPQAETFLDHVAPVVARDLRVMPPGRGWTVAGWSTGGFCAAKLGLSHPRQWGSVISFGGYYQPVTDHTTGDLFHGDRRLERENSPTWLYQRRGASPVPMLLIAGRQDRETWGTTSRFLAVAKGDPHVAYVDFPTGGHNYHNYRAYLGPALEWAKLPPPT